MQMVKLVTNKNWNALELLSENLQQLKSFASKRKTAPSSKKTGLTLKRTSSFFQPGIAVFYGADNDRKTTAAALVGKLAGNDVYKIDLSSVVSKYIGETEKNLDRLFARAESKNAILYFDEADALFGKRSDVKNAHDRYANIEVSYLLQRIQDHNNRVVLSTKNKKDIDPAFLRKATAVVRFPRPKK